MAVVLFYHLTRSGLADTVRGLAARAIAQGWRVVLRGTDPARLDQLDTALWLGPEEQFLPHGLASGGPCDARQPLLLCLSDAGGEDVVAGAQALMLVDGAGADWAGLSGLDRVWVLFDGGDPAAVEVARGQWKAVVAAGLPAQYWSDASGRWEKQAER